MVTQTKTITRASNQCLTSYTSVEQPAQCWLLDFKTSGQLYCRTATTSWRCRNYLSYSSKLKPNPDCKPSAYLNRTNSSPRADEKREIKDLKLAQPHKTTLPKTTILTVNPSLHGTWIRSNAGYSRGHLTVFCAWVKICARIWVSTKRRTPTLTTKRIRNLKMRSVSAQSI